MGFYFGALSLSYLVGILMYERVRKYISLEVSILIGTVFAALGLDMIGFDGYFINFPAK